MKRQVLKTGILLLAFCAWQSACTKDEDPDVDPPIDLASVDLLELAAQHTGFQRGLSYTVDGDDYYLFGPLEGGARDVPGHEWVELPGGWILGNHYNSGPFGISSWWSSDADDDQHLYVVLGKIDIWTPNKAAYYRSHGFSHYHKLVRVADRAPHPSKVVWMKRVAVASFNLDGGDMPWMAHPVIPGIDDMYKPNTQFPYPPREEFLYVVTADKGGADPDFLAVVGTNPNDPDTYSKISHRVDMPEIGDELHHFGFNIFQTRLLVPGLFSGRLHVLNIEDDPAKPYIESWHADLTEDSGYIIPHTVIGTPDGGYMLSMIGSATTDTAPGGIVKLNADAEFVAPFGPGSVRDPETLPPTYMYDVGINLLRNRMVTTTFGLPGDIGGAINPAGLGNEVYVWDYAAQEVIQVVDLGENTGALEVRWVHDPGVPVGFTNAPGTSEIWRWDDQDLDGEYNFELAIALPEGSIPTDMLLSHDDKYMYIANWMGNNVMQYDITDPFNPVFVSEVEIPHAQMMRLSPDNKRLYVTNSLLSTWDDTEFPEGVTRNDEYGLFLIDIDHYGGGGMTLNEDFFVDFDDVEKQNGRGAARPHQVFFDPNVRIGFGDH